jgi:hypothetical protein
MAPLCDLSNVNINEPRSFKLVWSDESAVRQRPLAEEGPDETDLVNLINPSKVMNHWQNTPVKSNIKG